MTRMSGMRILPAIASVGFVLAVPILLFTTNIRFLASDTGYLEGGLRRHDAAENTGIALNELDYAVGAIVRYFEDDADTLRILVFTGGQETALFSEDETLHMEDVKGLMRTIFRANEVALGFVLAYVAATVLWAGERSGRTLAKETLAAVGAGALVGVAVGIVALVGFDGAWNQLHEVLFTNDLWLLDPRTDRLIQMFPETFWAEATFIVVGMALAEAVVLVGAAGGYLWFTRPPRAERDEPGEEAADDDEAAEGEGEEEEVADSDEDDEEKGAEVSETVEGEPEEGGLEEEGSDDEEPTDETELEEVEDSPEEEEGEDQAPQPQPPPPQAQPPDGPNSGSI
ncbi:MAG: TIGR01906 family membrane protein [Dehalococcoidia bacterium]|nr:TIGR01906 family membrane protein [Dehalococcoidia bacterium]